MGGQSEVEGVSKWGEPLSLGFLAIVREVDCSGITVLMSSLDQGGQG